MITDAKLIDAGIDYIRLTTDSSSGQNALRSYYLQIRNQDVLAGYEEKKGGCFGFMGDKVRHALYGVKEGWTLLQVSGRAAKGTYMLANADNQCTRLDLQLTYRVDADEVQLDMEDIYMQLNAHKNGAHRPRAVKRIQEGYSTQTIYVGKRASDVFIRIYDKYAESGKEEYKDSIRFELELKGRVSKEVWRMFQEGELTLLRLLELVRDECKRQGVDMPSDNLSEDVTSLPKREATPVERTMQWASTMLPKAIRRISNEFGYMNVFRNIFSETLDDYFLSGIIKLISISSGN